MDKSPEAFRTISEVAETLETPAHVLRFWESRFPQIRPVKRAGGRRYYRPADVALLTGIKRLLHDEGLTIRGVQKILREQGVRHVAGLAGMPEADLAAFDPALALEEAMAEKFSGDPVAALPAAEVETAQIFALETALRRPAQDVKPVTADLFDLLATPVDTNAAAVVAADVDVPQPEPPPPDAETAGEPLALPETFSETTEMEQPAIAETAPETLVEPERVQAASGPGETAPLPDISRAALLRAVPVPLPDDLRTALLPVRARIARHRDHLREVSGADGHRV